MYVPQPFLPLKHSTLIAANQVRSYLVIDEFSDLGGAQPPSLNIWVNLIPCSPPTSYTYKFGSHILHSPELLASVA